MSIIATEIDSIHGRIGQQRMIFYRCQDHLGTWHNYGPVITTNDAFDAEAQKPNIAEIVAASLAESETAQLLAE
jgi:hypothetical protein